MFLLCQVIKHFGIYVYVHLREDLHGMPISHVQKRNKFTSKTVSLRKWGNIIFH